MMSVHAVREHEHGVGRERLWSSLLVGLGVSSLLREATYIEGHLMVQ